MEPYLRGHPDERPTPLEKTLANVNININVLISIPPEKQSLLHSRRKRGDLTRGVSLYSYVLILKLLQ